MPGITNPISLPKAQSLPKVTKASTTDWMWKPDLLGPNAPAMAPSHMHKRVTEALKSTGCHHSSHTGYIYQPSSNPTAGLHV